MPAPFIWPFRWEEIERSLPLSVYENLLRTATPCRVKELKVNIYRGRIDHEHMDPQIIPYVREFILKVSRDESVQWRGKLAIVQINQVVYRIVSGTVYEKRESLIDPIIYLAHASGGTRPDWLTGVLSGVAQFYGIDHEQEIIDALIKIATSAAINQFSSVPGAYLASTFSGVEITDIAIKRGSNLVAGLCPPEKEGEAKVWRLRETGEIVYPTTEDGWVSLSIHGGM